MKLYPLALAALCIAAPVMAETPSKLPEHVGFGSGATLGGVLGGPVGVVVGGTLGTLIGHDMVTDRQLAQKNEALAELHTDIHQARAQLADLNAKQAKQQAELAAFQRLLSELSVSVHFEVDSAMTAARYRQGLEAVAQASQEIEGLTVRMVGHADARGSESHNQALSAARAASVGAVLSQAGASQNALTAEARGERGARGEDQCGSHALDRRVDLHLGFETPPSDRGLYSAR
jgi:outer membrane protein OmpA-like peptidoglycan-associated protein